jgi:3-hydroxyisobutyrate dehydrogenase
VIVDSSTIHASTAEALAARVAKTGAQFLDGPVSGGKEGAKNGTLSMMVGGDIQALEQVRPVLEVITGRITHMGTVGSGQKTKAVNQVMAAGINQAVSEALAFAQAMNLPLEKVLEVVSNGAAGNWFVEHRGPSMIQNRFPPGFKLALHDKDLGICQQLAELCGGALPVVDQTREDYRMLMQQGQGEQDISALYSLKQGLFRHQD